MKKIVVLMLIIVFLMPFFMPPLSWANENFVETNKAEEEEDVQTEDKMTQDDEKENNKEKNNIQVEEKEKNKEENNNTDVSDSVTENEKLDEGENQAEGDVISEEKNIIEEGIYYISSALNEKMVFDIESSSQTDGAKLQLWGKSEENTDNQKFKVTYNEEGYYEIEAVHSGKVLEISGISARTRIQQYEKGDSEGQKWIIQKTSDGYYSIISKANGLCMDVAGGTAQDGSVVQMYEKNGSQAQKFVFKKIEDNNDNEDDLIGEKTIEEGTYYISSALNEKMVFDIESSSQTDGAKLQLWGKSEENTDNQKFKVTYNEEGYYEIEAVHSEKVLDVAGAGTTNGTRVQQYDSNESNAQKWIIKDAGEGYYYIVSKCNGLYIDIPGAIAQDGSTVQMYEANGSKAQKFKFEKIKEIGDIIGEKTIEDGVYKIKLASNEKLGLDIEGSSKANQANLQIWGQSELIVKNQRFEVTYNEEGYYTIKALHSGKVLDVSGAGMTNGTNVQQYDANGTKSQQWVIKENKDGTYSIISRQNGLYLNIENGEIKEGSNVNVYEENKADSQKFKFEKVEEKCKKLIKDGIYTISTALNTNMVLDIADGSYQNGANLQLWGIAMTQQQKFEVTYNEEGYYEIKSVNSGKMLDVAGGSNANGTKIRQYESNETEYQKWIIQDAGNGYYYIASKGAEAYLDVAGASTQNGASITIYEMNGTNAQKFKFKEVPIIYNDSYNIETSLRANRVLDMDLTNSYLQIWTLNQQSENQRFKLEYIDGDYKIICSATNKVLTANQTSVIQDTYEGAENQKWKIEIAGDGYYYIKSKSTGLYLDVTGASDSEGTRVNLYEKNETNAQKFAFNSVNIFYGIDVSYANKLINWLQVKQSNQVSFTMIRAAYRGYATGKIVTDEQFERNIMQASGAGIDIGLYFFTQATNEAEAIEEADYIVNLMRRHNINIKYPIAIDTEYSGSKTNGQNDYEGRADNLTPTQRTNVCIAFCERIKSYGYTPMIYASRNWFYDNLEADRLVDYEHWVAHYTGSVDSPTNYKYHYTMWQYTSSGSVSGIEGRVDLNICNKKY